MPAPCRLSLLRTDALDHDELAAGVTLGRVFDFVHQRLDEEDAQAFDRPAGRASRSGFGMDRAAVANADRQIGRTRVANDVDRVGAAAGLNYVGAGFGHPD